MRQIRLYLALVVTLVMVTGCSTINDARQAEGSGKKVTYQSSFDDVWSAAAFTVYEFKMRILSDSKKDGTILAVNPVSAFSSGENVAVFVRAVAEKETSVEVVSKRVMATNVFAPEWTNRIQDKIAQKLGEGKEISPIMTAAAIRYSPTIETKGVNYEKYRADLLECNEYARNSSGTASAALDGAVGGAVVGAALAAAAGSGYDKSASARVGAVAGGVGGAAQSENSAADIVRRCIASRGYTVLQ